MGLASIWAFVGPKYQNAPENVPLAVNTMHAPEVERIARA
jgi:hypothetical protein